MHCVLTHENTCIICFTLSALSRKCEKEKTSKSRSESQTQTSEYQISCSKVLLWSHKKLAMELFWLRSDWKTGFSLMHFLFVERSSLKIKSNLYELVRLSVLSESRSFKGVVCICIYIITMDMYCSLDVFFIHG